MFRLISILAILAAPASAQTAAPGSLPSEHPLLAPLFQPVQAYDCSRKTCGQIASCEEACYKLTVCGDTARDGDNDGIPCENLCSRRC